MVDEFLSEDEQAEAVKRWFSENWLWMAAGIVIGLGGLFGWQYYERQKLVRAEASATLLQRLADARAGSRDQAEEPFKKMVNDYAGTPYAEQARLIMASAAIGDNKLEEAATQLREVMDHSKDAELAQVARLRLARVLIEQKKPDDALTLLDVSKAGAFAAQVQEVRGDAFFSKADMTSARAAYQAAIDAHADDTTGDLTLLELKLQETGGELRAAKATVAGAAQ